MVKNTLRHPFSRRDRTFRFLLQVFKRVPRHWDAGVSLQCSYTSSTVWGKSQKMMRSKNWRPNVKVEGPTLTVRMTSLIKHEHHSWSMCGFNFFLFNKIFHLLFTRNIKPFTFNSQLRLATIAVQTNNLKSLVLQTVLRHLFAVPWLTFNWLFWVHLTAISFYFFRRSSFMWSNGS